LTSSVSVFEAEKWVNQANENIVIENQKRWKSKILIYINSRIKVCLRMEFTAC